MRFLRVFRLFNARLSSDRYVSLDLATHMKKITTLSCFIEAHLHGQKEMVEYFGGNGKLDEKNEIEIARCILQSQIAVYRALIAAAVTQQQISPAILTELCNLYQRKRITQVLRGFVEKAHEDGAIVANEAHQILHPLNSHISSCMKTLNDRSEGVISNSTFKQMLSGDPFYSFRSSVRKSENADMMATIPPPSTNGEQT